MQILILFLPGALGLKSEENIENKFSGWVI